MVEAAVFIVSTVIVGLTVYAIWVIVASLIGALIFEILKALGRR